MDIKEKRKQYYINNRDKIYLKNQNNIIMIIKKKGKNIIMNIGL